jgi:hypothetical protein
LLRAVELLEDLEAANLELAVDEVLLRVVRRDGFREEILHALIDAFEHFVEVRRELLDHLGLDGGVRVLHGPFGAAPDELADEVLHERFLFRVEVAVDVPERRQIEDHGVHLLLGDSRIVGEDHARDGTPARATAWSVIDARMSAPPAMAKAEGSSR